MQLSHAIKTGLRSSSRASAIKNPVTNAEQSAGKRAKALDPTRPICFPKKGSVYSKEEKKIEQYADIGTPHYPKNSELRNFATKSMLPVIVTEYAHALGIFSDRIQDQWEIMQASPRLAGGAIWHFQDQVILRAATQPSSGTGYTEAVWVDKDHCYDTNGKDGSDGIVYSDRTHQSDYWETRKVYSPVQIAEKRVSVQTGDQHVKVTIENRHDFRSLGGMKIAWSLKRNNADIQHGENALKALSHEKETVDIQLLIPKDAAGDVLALELRCINENGLQLTERVVQLDLDSTRRTDWTGELKSSGKTNG